MNVDYSKPKNGMKFRVVGVARISTEHQDERSLEDQKAYYENHLDRTLGAGSYELRVVSSRGSGQILDSSVLAQLAQMVESGVYDLVIAEDLGRISRRIYAIIFCEEAEDSKTRVIAINDCVDTAEPNWKQASIFASFKNESFCKDTSARIKRSLRNRFQQGQIFQCQIYGYDKPHAKATDAEVSKLPEAESVYDHWFTMLEDGCSYQQVADWLNANNIPTGPYCRSDTWNGSMVGRVTCNPLLKGERVRNKRVAVRVNKTGRSKTEKAPPGHQLSRVVEHLAFIEPERYDRVIRMLKKRNARYKRSETEQNDPRSGIPKRHTRFPGQHIRCGICGRLFVYGGHGKTPRLMCKGARTHECWNGMTICGPEVATAISQKLQEIIENLEGFDDAWIAEYERQRTTFTADKNEEAESLKKKTTPHNCKLANQIEALDRIGVSDSIVARIKELEAERLDLKDKIAATKRSLASRPEIPSLGRVKDVAQTAFSDLAIGSVEFGDLMRKIVSDFWVLPYKLVDGGRVQPRLILKVSLAALLDGSQAEVPILEFDAVVDMFKPPHRVVIRKDAVAMVESGMTHAAVADKLAVTNAEVGYAMRLHRLMVASELNSPWVPVTSEDQVRENFKRVRNHRYKFRPLEGFEVTKHPTE